MPFTPFHLGPACALKVVAGQSFSLTVFAFCQVVMDVEPLLYLLCGKGIVHGVSHTYLGGTVLAVFSLLAGCPACQRLLNYWVPRPDQRFQMYLRGPRTITWPAAASGAFVGAYSHVLLDSMIHADVRPFAPFSDANPMQGLVSFAAMHFLCAGVGLLGLLGLSVVYLLESGS